VIYIGFLFVAISPKLSISIVADVK
jgi:hypothetical protein